MTVLSIDLAKKSYADIGVCSLEYRGQLVQVTPIRLSEAGLTGKPTTDTLAKSIAILADQLSSRLIFIDGPQAWKSPDNGLPYSRVCERELATQGKTGLPGFTKPSNYAPFISFAIELFDQLSELGWPRLPSESAVVSSRRFALESFPTSAWRSLGLRSLPGKARTPVGAVQAKLAELRSLVPVVAPNNLTHDELQALVAGLAGVAIEGHATCSYTIAGVAPFQLDGSWREGFIVSPIRRAAFQQDTATDGEDAAAK